MRVRNRSREAINALALWSACALLAIAIAAANAAARGSTGAGERATRTLKIVYSGIGEAENVQHVDNRPGHGGSAYDDTYSKNVAWKISWLVTIQDDTLGKVGNPVGEVTGTGRAVVRSNPAQSCVGKKVSLPGGVVPINFTLVSENQQFITVKLTYQPPYYEMIPLAWADVPGCAAAVSLPVQRFVSAGNTAIAAWQASEQPEFRIALFNNYKTTPSTFAHVWTFGPQGAGQKTFTYRWSSRIKSEPA